GLDLEREIALGEDDDLLPVHRHRERLAPDPLGEPAQRLRGLRRGGRPVELELALVTHYPAPLAVKTLISGRRGHLSVTDTRCLRFRCLTSMSRSTNSAIATAVWFWPETTASSPDKIPLASSER